MELEAEYPRDVPSHEKFKCVAYRIEYDFETRVGTVVLADDNRADMAGCIAVFEAIDPSVGFIRSMQEYGEKETAFVRGKTEWVEVRSPW